MREEYQFIMVDINDDPERMAEELIADSLPKTLLSEIDISTNYGFFQFLDCFIIRQNQAAIEKEEIITFVERNRKGINAGALQLLHIIISKTAKNAPKEKDGENILISFEYFLKNVNHVVKGHLELVNVRSDRLLWLIYALALSLSSQNITYEKALFILQKSKHKQCISPLALNFIIRDYVRVYDTPQEALVESWMLLLECALMIDHEPTITAGSILLSQFTPPFDTTNWLAVLKRCHSWLIQNGKKIPKLQQNLRRIESRFSNRVSEDDF